MRSRIAKFVAILVLAVVAILVPHSAWALCAPTTSGIFPASGVVGTTVTATVPGSGLAGATVGVFGEPGLAVTVQTTTDTAVNLQLQIDPAAVAGERILSLTTAAGTVAVGFTVNAAGGPIVASVSPTPTATQGFALVLAISGQNLAGLTTANVAVSGAGVTVTDATAALDGTRLDVALAVAADADLGTHALTISSPAGGAVLQLYVQRPAPTIATVSPGAGEIGTAVPLTITGTGLTGAALVVTSGDGGAGGITISDVATPDDGTLTATLTLASTLSPETEPRLLIVTTESGQVTAEFFVVVAGLPSITGLRPGAAEPGETASLTIRGLNLTGATVTTPSSALTLQNVVVVDDETITLDAVVSAGATADTDHTLVVAVGLTNDTADFRVVAADAPFLGAVRPPFGNRGTTFAVILDGVNLSTVVAGTGVDLSGPKIIESNAQAIDDRTVRAILEVDPTASVGFRDVTVTTETGSATRTASFRVNIPGQVPIITDVQPLAVDAGTTTSITVTGTGFAGAGVTVGGPGATVGNVVVDPTGTTITFDLTLSDTAPAENRGLLVVTENGIARCGVLSSAEIDFRAATLAKTGAVFEALTPGFRLFVFEFSLNERFDSGVRTHRVPSAVPLLVLSRADAESVGRAIRGLPFGYVRVQALTATNLVATSAPFRFRY